MFPSEKPYKTLATPSHLHDNLPNQGELFFWNKQREESIFSK